MVIAGVSVASLAAGVAMSYCADAYPRQQDAMEAAAGVLLIAGFGLLGCLIERILGAP